MKWIKWIVLSIGLAVSAYFGLPVLLIYLIAVSSFFLFRWLLRKFGKRLPEQALKKSASMVRQKKEESKGEPYITVQHGPEGIKGMEVGFDDEADGQPGTGKFNPMEATLQVIRMRQLEAEAVAAKAANDILSSNQPYTLKEIALRQIDRARNNSVTTTPSKTPSRKRRKGEDFVGISREGNYSIQE